MILDRYVHPAPAEGWPHWMDRNLDEAKFVLMVCTETYRRRVMGLEEPGKGLGVRWEGNLIYNRIYHDKPSGSRFIPILLPSSEPAHIPNPVQGHSYYRIATFDLTDPGFEALYRHLTDQPATPRPDLGALTILPPKPRPRPSPSPLSPGGPMTNVPGATSPAPSDLDDRIRAVLRPLMATEQSRQARLTRAFHAYPGLLDRVATGAETSVFLSHLLQTLRDYGEVEPGMPALRVLLESIRDEVGAGDRAKIDQIIQRLEGIASLGTLGVVIVLIFSAITTFVLSILYIVFNINNSEHGLLSLRPVNEISNGLLWFYFILEFCKLRRDCVKSRVRWIIPEDHPGRGRARVRTNHRHRMTIRNVDARPNRLFCGISRGIGTQSVVTTIL